MNTKDMYKDLIVGSSVIVVLAVTLIIGIQFLANRSFDIPEYQDLKNALVTKDSDSVKTFSSAQEFKQYLENVEENSMMQGQFVAAPEFSRTGVTLNDLDTTANAMPSKSLAEGDGVNRVSDTNVQVIGIDEPDIVKTDGKEIYVSNPNLSFMAQKSIVLEEVASEREMMPVDSDRAPAIYPPLPVQGGVQAVQAFPPADMKIDGTIDGNGDLLLADDMLLVIGQRNLYGYNVADPSNPKEIWSIDVEEGNQVMSSRLYDNTLYLITKTSISRGNPCPITPLRIDGRSLEIACDSIYHPVTPVPVDATFSIMKIDIKKGEAEQETAFVGSHGQSSVYMSKNALYISYMYPVSMLDVMLPFIEKNADVFSSEIVNKARKLQGYDISESSKLQELTLLLEESLKSLTSDERLKFENEMENRMQQHLKENRREMEKTGIAKITLDNLTFDSIGIVPGLLLNQFSMDEHEGNLRVATTVGGNWNQFGGRQQSVNDVNIFNSKMRVIGSVQDMGIDERIYSVRFLGDKGYVVTFRQIDPFIVLDLSDPKKPQKRGELKIPGFSSYLHPLKEDRILGIGKEDSNVKISLFDVSDPDNPIERSKYLLDEYWSDISNTHHAFLQDEKHGVFFLPGSKGGYIFAYDNDVIEMEKAISGVQARRALYINDYMYIVGLDKIVVLNESDWERVNELELK